jgi:hypothetical protein
MKKLLILLLSLIVISCNYPDYIRETKGIINQIQQQNGQTVVEIKFKYYDSENIYSYVWFIGSDTCKVGQIVQLK